MSDKTSDKTSDKRLLPCPFCGGEAEIKIGSSGTAHVECSKCNVSSALYWVCIGGRERAIAAWNTRKPMERIVERLEELRMAEYDDSDEEPVYTDAEDIFDDGVSSGKFKAYYEAIKIVKEET